MRTPTIPLTPIETPDSGLEHPRTSNEHLHTLYTRLIDAKAGFDVMVEKAEPEFLDVAKSFQEMHARHAGVISDMLHGDVDMDGSLMGTVNKAVVTLRSWFDEIDDDVMDQVRRGERQVLDAYRVAEAESDKADEARLVGLRAELEDLLKRTAHLD